MRSAFHAKILVFKWGSRGWKFCIVVYLGTEVHVRYM